MSERDLILGAADAQDVRHARPSGAKISHPEQLMLMLRCLLVSLGTRARSFLGAADAHDARTSGDKTFFLE